MASKERHQELASTIKGVHADLRKAFQEGKDDFENIWKEHVANNDLLKQYANAMSELANDVWTKHDLTRIEWCKNSCSEYFFGDGFKKVLEKDARRLEYQRKKTASEHFENTLEQTERFAVEELESNVSSSPGRTCEKLRLLDVGSCYNPFKVFPEFLPLAIDISPAHESVHHCDFLCLQVDPPLDDRIQSGDDFLLTVPPHVLSLPGDLFHVVVFSLLLEYLPSPHHRWLCCEKALQLLVPNGLLLIITPDSKHQNKNAAIMTSWRDELHELGFCRWKYIKLQHLHCMAFRRLPAMQTSDRKSHEGNYSKCLYIPQDFSTNLDSENEKPHPDCCSALSPDITELQAVQLTQEDFT